MSLLGINLITWNVTGIMSSAAFLSQVLTECDIDICGLSEHWLLPHNVHFMDNLSTDSNHHTLKATILSANLYGEVALLLCGIDV